MATRSERFINFVLVWNILNIMTTTFVVTLFKNPVKPFLAKLQSKNTIRKAPRVLFTLISALLQLLNSKNICS